MPFQEELIDKFEAAADGINADMALAEKALKVGGKTFEVADFKTISAAHSFFSLQHDLPSNQETVDSCPYFCIFKLIFELLIKQICFPNHLISMTIKFVVSLICIIFIFPLFLSKLPHLFVSEIIKFEECFYLALTNSNGVNRILFSMYYYIICMGDLLGPEMI